MNGKQIVLNSIHVSIYNTNECTNIETTMKRHDMKNVSVCVLLVRLNYLLTIVNMLFA